MSYTIVRRNLKKGTMEVLYEDGKKLNVWIPQTEEGTVEFDAEVEKNSLPPPPLHGLYIPSDPDSSNPFRKTIPIYDRR
jgi:hypothetical protein